MKPVCNIIPKETLQKYAKALNLSEVEAETIVNLYSSTYKTNTKLPDEKELVEFWKKTNQIQNKNLVNQSVAETTTSHLQYRKQLSVIDGAVDSNKWTPEALKELENLIKDIKNGKINFKRTVGERFSQASSRSEIHAGAFILLRRNAESGARKYGDKKEEHDRDAEEGRSQEKIIEHWAKAAGIWFNDFTDELGNKANTLEDLFNSEWDFMNIGSEAEVFKYDEHNVIKSINLSHSNDNIALALDRITLYNQLFPETALNIVGFGRDSMNHFRIIVTQPYVKGKELTVDGLKKFHDRYKFKKQGKWFSTADGTVLIYDLAPSNILKTKNGNFIVVDIDAVYNTQRYGGPVKYNTDPISENDTPYQFVTIAPYFRSKLTSDNMVDMAAATKSIQEKAQKLAAELGLTIKAVIPMAGTYLGSSEISWQYQIESADQEKIDLFASLMGDLSNEYQDAVIAANYVSKEQWDSQTENKAIELSYEVPYGTTTEFIEKTLQDAGIDGSSYDMSSHTLTITAFSEEEVREIVNKLKNSNYEYKGHSYQNSRYLENSNRQTLYRTWIKSSRNQENRKLYNACSKALAICEATEGLKESERLEAARKAAEKWDREHIKDNAPYSNTLNIWNSSNENADLSNFAERPFTHTWKDGKTTQFISVEQAFQFSKARMANDRESARKILAAKTGEEIKSLGRQVKGLDSAEWDRSKQALMKAFIKESFEQNPSARQRLIDTGNAVLTHTQAGDEWAEAFPRLLMEVRSELSGMKRPEGTSSSASETSRNPEEFTIFSGTLTSGRPEGSDLEWQQKGADYGMRFIGFAPQSITGANRETAEAKVKEASKQLERPFPTSSTEKDGYLLRNWLQVENSDMVVAIADRFVTTDVYTDPQGNTYGGRIVVDGGTGWAVQMAINEGKPVYVYNQSDQRWYTWENGVWKASDVPVLTKKFAGIGTRKINEFGKRAIKDVLEKNFGKMNTVDTDSYQPTYQLDPNSIGNNEALERYATDFNAEQRRNRIQLVSRVFSSQLDRLVAKVLRETERQIADLEIINRKAPSRYNERKLRQAERRLESFRDPERGRAAVLDYYGVLKFVNDDVYGLAAYFKEITEMSDKDFAEQWDETLEDTKIIKEAYKKVLDNMDLLFKDALPDIEYREGIKIDMVNMNNHLIDDEAQKALDEDFDADEDGGDTVHGNEGFIYKVRFSNPYSTASAKTKRILNNIYKRDSKGNGVMDDMHNSMYYSGEYIHAVLINELSTMIRPEDFYDKENNRFPALERIAYSVDENGNIRTDENGNEIPGKYPWAKQIIQILEYDPDAVSTFYTDFRKDFISYYLLSKKGGEEDSHLEGSYMNRPSAMAAARAQALQYYETDQKVNEDAIYHEGKVIEEKVSLGKKLLHEVESLLPNTFNGETISEENLKAAVEKTVHLVGMLGFRTSEKAIYALYDNINGNNEFDALLTYIGGALNTAPKVKGHLFSDKKMNGNLNGIAERVGILEELDNVQTVRQGDKTFYSYSAPNYYDTLLKQLKQRGQAQKTFINERFKKFTWFYRNGQWYHEWMRLIDEEPTMAQEMLTTQLEFIDGEDYRNWTPKMITESFIYQYFSEGMKTKNDRYGWYSSPIFSDSPAVKLIRMMRYTDEGTHDPEVMKRKLVPLFRNVIKQEMHRIALVEERKKAIKEGKISPIVNFDDNGDKFFFFHELNDYKIGEEQFKEVLGKELSKKNPDMDFVNRTIDAAVRDLMNKGFERYWQKQVIGQGIDERLKKDLGRKDEKDNDGLKHDVEEYYWNQKFANTQIIQMTTTDLAFYKDLNLDGGVDFQKRYKEVYAAGSKLNTLSKYGKKTERAVYLKDIIRISTGLKSIEKALDRAVAQGKLNELAKDDILNKFRKINTTDAQAFRSMKSFRSILDMMGLWNDKMQKAYDRLTSRNGEWDMDDFYVIWNTIKPFVFTQIEKPTKADSERFGETMLVPHQNKNSEFLLMATYGLMSYALDDSPMMKGIARLMENNDIDVVQFESAVKVGGQGTIDISYSPEKLENVKKEKDKNGAPLWNEIMKEALEVLGEKKFKEASDIDAYRAGLQSLLDKNKISQEFYNEYIEKVSPDEDEVERILTENIKGADGKDNPEVVHEIDYADYMIAQPTPPHLVDAKAVFGSQFRNIIEADLPDDESFKVNVNGTDFTKKEVKMLYKSLIVENLLDDFEELKERFGSIESLQKALLTIIEGNPKYGREIRDALEIVEYTDPDTHVTTRRFNIPLNNPSTTRKVQEIVNSMFKNSIQKQKINGGACILVSNFGHTDKLHMIYGENGEVIGAECYLPAWSKVFFQEYINPETGELIINDQYDENHHLVKKGIPENLRKIIAYRIPTEHKYSMLPLYVKGFLPSQNGSVIMLPMETLTNSGEDFDVDKKFLMIPQFSSENLDVHALIRDFRKTAEGKNLSNDELKEIVECLMSGTPMGTEAETSLFEFLGNAEGKYGTLSPAKIEYDMNESPENQGKAVMKNAEQKVADRRAEVERLIEAMQSLDEKIKDAEEALKEAKEVESSDETDTEEKKNKAANERIRAEKKLEGLENRYNEDAERLQRIEDSPELKEGYLERMKRRQREIARAARNNMLIDISYAILTHPDISYQIHHPGNFDNVKRASRIAQILENEELIKDLNERFDNDREKVKDYLLNPKHDADFLEKDLIGKHKTIHNPIEPGTFEYFHRQNMTGDALIGMYANNTSAQAKYQGTGISIKEPFRFIIDGRHISDMTRVEEENPSGRDNILISFNCAEFSAASVDNAKDPILADLKQNMKTANITGTMLRMGMSIKQIGLVFSLPAVREIVDTTGGLNNKSVEMYISNLIKLAKELKLNAGLTQYVSMSEFTSSEMIDASLDFSMLKPLLAFGQVSPEMVDEKDAKNVQKAIGETLKYLYLLDNIIDITGDMKTVTKISRADSPNGAALPSLAGVKAQTREVELFRRRVNNGDSFVENISSVPVSGLLDENESISDMREALLGRELSSLQAFYSLGIDMAARLAKRYFPQESESFNDTVDMVLDECSAGRLNTERRKRSDVTYDDLYKEMTTFALANTRLFGDDGTHTYAEKRDYYIYQYPKKFMEILKNNKVIRDLPIMQKMQVKDGKICLVNSGRQTADMKDTLMRAMDSLLYLKTPEALHMVEDLLKYSYYVEQLDFGPNSFGNFISPMILSKFPEFSDALRDVEKFYTSMENRENFKKQFFAQHGESISTLVHDGALLGEFNGRIVMKSDGVLNHASQTARHLEYINFRSFKPDYKGLNGLYILEDETAETATYRRADYYGDRDYVQYNPKSDVETMASVKFNRARWEALKTLQNSVTKIEEDEESATEKIARENQDDYSEVPGSAKFTVVDNLDDHQTYAKTPETQRYKDSDSEKEMDTPFCP